ncbi:MAG: DUF1501 domain-containing protein [Bdellovibrio sp.]|nr:DUF1501 domain-containing protein [Bdellovibrio sp.]
MCDDSMNNKSRRNFLTGAFTLGAGTFILDPIRALSEGITDHFISQAMAETTGTVASRNYVNVQMGGAPIRYQFDQWLRTSVSDVALANVAATGALNPMICNSFNIDSAGKVTMAMRTTTYRNMIVPIIFSQSVYNSKGQKRALTDLLNNMLVVRGYGSGLDGHQFNIIAQQAPIGGVPTLTAIAAESSPTTFDSIQWPDRGGNGTFISNAGKAQNKIPGTTPLTTLMEGFGTPANKAAYNLKNTYASSMELAQARLKSYARSNNAGSKIVSQNLTNATDMMKKGVSNLASYWSEAVPRYQAAIYTSMRESNLPGISDKPLISDETAPWAVGTGDILKVSKNMDARDMIKAVTISNFAQSMALTEYILKEGLAASLDVRADGLAGLAIRGVNDTAAISRNLGLDIHATGAPMVVLLMTAYFRAIAAGILELSDQLGPQLWSNTVVQLQGDFGRTARSNGTGSDHGYNQMVTSAFSGAFNNGPIVVGNIKQAGSSANYDGTQGLAAAISGYNQSGAPNPAMAASTVTALLGVSHNPFANTASPLVSLTNGTLKTAATAKIVT